MLSRFHDRIEFLFLQALFHGIRLGCFFGDSGFHRRSRVNGLHDRTSFNDVQMSITFNVCVATIHFYSYTIIIFHTFSSISDFLNSLILVHLQSLHTGIFTLKGAWLFHQISSTMNTGVMEHLHNP